MLQWAILKKLNKEPNGSFRSATLTKKKPKGNENQGGWIWLIEERTGEQDDEIIKITLSVQRKIFWGHK